MWTARGMLGVDGRGCARCGVGPCRGIRGHFPDEAAAEGRGGATNRMLLGTVAWGRSKFAAGVGPLPRVRGAERGPVDFELELGDGSGGTWIEAAEVAGAAQGGGWRG